MIESCLRTVVSMMKTHPYHLRADATEGKEQGCNQNKEEEPPVHDPGELEAEVKLWNDRSRRQNGICRPRLSFKPFAQFLQLGTSFVIGLNLG